MKLKFLILILTGCLFCKCEKEVIVPDLSGNVVGYLSTYDEFGQLKDHSGVQVSTQGINGSYSTTSDKNGRYEFGNLPAGTYDLVFEKEGFSNDTMFGMKHLGGKPTILGRAIYSTIYTSTHLFKIPVLTIENLTLQNDTLSFSYKYPGTPQSVVGILLYFSDQDGFENKTAIIFSQQFVLVNGFYKSVFLPFKLPYQPGDHFYARAAAISRGYTNCATIDEQGNYVDCVTGIIFNPITGDESDQFTLVFPE